MVELRSGDKNWYSLKDDIALIYEQPRGPERERGVKRMRKYIRDNYYGRDAEYLIDNYLKYY